DYPDLPSFPTRRSSDLRRADLRIFAETLALAVRHNVRRGRTTGELQELLDEIRSRPGLFRVAIFDPNGQMVAASATSGGTAGPRSEEHTSELQSLAYLV